MGLTLFFVALELSLARWGVAFGIANGEISDTMVAGGDLPGLAKTIARARVRLADQLERPITVRCCDEAGYDGFWLARALIAAGIATWVFDPASLLVARRRRRVKTARREAEMLVRAALARGERRGSPGS